MTDEKDMVFISVQLEKKLKEDFEKAVGDQERTVSGAIRFLIKEYLWDYGYDVSFEEEDI